MNKWIRRTAGTVGIAGGALLLGTAAHADSPVLADPQALTNVADAANLDGGVSGLGVSVDTPGQRDTVGLLPDGGNALRSGTNNGELGATVHAPTQGGQPRDIFANTGRTPDLFQALPITDVVPMDGLGLPTGGRTAPLAPSSARKPSPGRPAADRILPAQAESGPLGETGLPVRNIPLSTDVAGDPLAGGDSLTHDGLAGNGLGVPMGDRLPVGTVQGLASQGGSALGSLPLGGSPLDALGGVGGVDGVGGLGGLGADEDQDSRSQGTPVVAGDAVHVLPPTESAELPGADDLPVFGSILNGGTLPTRANINTLPGAAPIPVHSLLAPGTSATGASTGAAYDNASGAVNGMMSGDGTEALPLGDEGLPVVGGLTGPRGTSGIPLDAFGELPVVGGVANGGGPLGGALGGKHRKPATGAQYVPRHSA
jgi:hypothetical protein